VRPWCRCPIDGAGWKPQIPGHRTKIRKIQTQIGDMDSYDTPVRKGPKRSVEDRRDLVHNRVCPGQRTFALVSSNNLVTVFQFRIVTVVPRIFGQATVANGDARTPSGHHR
jgi:hypothetical protein